MTRQKNGIWKLTDAEMNSFACFCGEASKRYEELNLQALSKEAKETEDAIFNVLDEIGYYDEV